MMNWRDPQAVGAGHPAAIEAARAAAEKPAAVQHDEQGRVP